MLSRLGVEPFYEKKMFQHSKKWYFPFSTFRLLFLCNAFKKQTKRASSKSYGKTIVEELQEVWEMRKITIIRMRILCFLLKAKRSFCTSGRNFDTRAFFLKTFERTSQKIMIFNCITENIGKTPLISLSRLFPHRNILGKLESQNPGSSLKDRTALAMIVDAEERGILLPGGTLVEPTSGNTGIGLALVCAARGYECILTMPENMSQERQQMMRFLNAELILTPAEKGMTGAIAKAEEIILERNAFSPNQFENPQTQKFMNSRPVPKFGKTPKEK